MLFPNYKLIKRTISCKLYTYKEPTVAGNIVFTNFNVYFCSVALIGRFVKPNFEVIKYYSPYRYVLNKLITAKKVV